MSFNWESKQERALKGCRMSATKKLEGIRLMNELAEKILSRRQKKLRQKLRKSPKTT